MFNPANFNGRDTDVFEGRKSLALVALPDEAATDIEIAGCERLA
jgi:hypothetical protein